MRVVAPIRVNGGRSILTERAPGLRRSSDRAGTPERRVEDLLNGRGETMDLVDEQDVARLQVGELGGEVAGAHDHRPRGQTEADPELGGDDLGERGLAKPGRPGEQNMVERRAAGARRR